MNQLSDMQNKQPLESSANDNSALSAALSVHYILLALYFFGTLGSAALLFISFMSNTKSDVVLIAISMLPPILFCLHLFAVKGLNRKKPWAYNTSKVLGYLLLPAFPFGTVLGLILLSQLSKFRFAN